MAGSSISGNAGSSAVGVQIQCVPLNSANGTQIQIADGSGNFTFSGLSAGIYILYADTRNLTVAGGSAYQGFVYRQPTQVTVDGVSSYTGIVITVPVAANTPTVET
jgi:hypothetical protein